MAKATLENKTIAIIGGGRMGSALAEGLAKGGKISPLRVWVTDPTLTKIKHLRKFGIKITTDNSIVSEADIIFLAVKPKAIKEVLGEIKHLIKNKVLVSVAAIPTISKLKTASHKNQRIARIMPNLPVKYNRGVIGFFKGSIRKSEEAELAKILSSLGTVVKVKKEKGLDIITLVTACGPAIISVFIELFTDYAKRNHISEQAVLRTFSGTLEFLNKSDISPPQFKKSVATKGGITEAILKSLDNDFKKSFVRAMNKGHIKINTLNKLW